MKPTDYLVMEVLVARYRLGEEFWTFPNRIRPILERLQSDNLIWWKPGVAQGTSIAGLSDGAKDIWLTKDYHPPRQFDTLDLGKIFEGVQIKFWDCPENHPRLPQRVRIEWTGDIATCLDCGRTNKDPIE